MKLKRSIHRCIFNCLAMEEFLFAIKKEVNSRSYLYSIHFSSRSELVNLMSPRPVSSNSVFVFFVFLFVSLVCFFVLLIDFLLID